MNKLLQVENLRIDLPTGRNLIEGLTFSLEEGEVLWIQGENGKGKSTLISAILGKFPTSKGTIKLSPPKEKVAFLPQTYFHQSVLPMTLGEVIQSGLNDPNAEKRMNFVPLLKPVEDFPKLWNSSSGGEQKRALLFKSLLEHPDLLILDEPFNHLDEGSIKSIGHLLETGTKKGSNFFNSAIIVSHLLPEALKESEHLRILKL